MGTLTNIKQIRRLVEQKESCVIFWYSTKEKENTDEKKYSIDAHNRPAGRAPGILWAIGNRAADGCVAHRAADGWDTYRILPRSH